MAEINPPAWMQAGSYPARTDRLTISALLGYPGFLVDESTPTRIRQGVKPSYQQQQMKVRAAATPNMTVIVSAGFAFVDQHDTGGLGTYVCVNDADKTLTVQPAGGAGQYRKDAVVASVYDAETAGAANEWRLEIIQGTYAASAGAAARPSLPSNCVLLADLSIGPSQTSVATANIADVRNFAVAAGGVLPVSSSAAPNRPHPGQVLYLTNTDTFVYGKQDGTTANLLQSAGASAIGSILFARLTANFDRQSGTLGDVTGLMLNVAANAVYVVEAMLHWSTTDETNSDLNMDWACPAGATGTYLGFAQPTSQTTTDGVVRTMSTDIDASRTYGAEADAGNPDGMLFRALLITAGTAGVYGPQIARTAGTGIITMRKDSWVKLQRVA
ncbi:hypothetical protein AB0M10_32810 [Streptomyces sp. NPDC051840]|uniref:hypothetical protein n=1 Tax=Streptomyces sp. NPDC051840 TaxID=3154752 RepID=UPI003419273C